MSISSDAAGEAYGDLVQLVETLRDPGGCPWDREQTHVSLRPHLIEEAYEALEAFDSRDNNAIEEELGDLMTHVVFHADIGRREDAFDGASVARRVIEKLRRRHPHVFSDGEKIGQSQDVVDRWEALKRAESGKTSVASSLPSAMPALAYSASLQKRASRAGVPVESAYPAAEPRFERIDDESEEQLEKRAGITALDEQIHQRWDEIADLDDRIEETPARSLEGVAIKLRIYEKAGRETVAEAAAADAARLTGRPS